MSDSNESDDFDSKSSNFLTWLTQRGASISSHIKLADLRQQNAGRGIVTTTPLPADTELFRIPRRTILTPTTSSVPPSSLTGLSDPWLTLILAMVYEFQGGATSPWKPYFDLLPTHFDTPMFWTSAELSLLTGSAVVSKIGRASADATFTRELLPRIRAHADSFHAQTLDDAALLSLCHRMGSTIMAYAFDLEEGGHDRTAASGSTAETEEEWEEDDENPSGTPHRALPKGMVPLADMLNADAARNNARLFHEDADVVMRTLGPVEAGAELFNDYGPLPRADLLRRYGYVTDRYAAYDVVEVSLELIKERTGSVTGLRPAEIEERTEYLDGYGILDDAYDVARSGSEDGQFSEELCGLLNALTVAPEDFEKMRRKDKLPKPELSEAARRLLRAVVVHRYAMYPEPGSGMNLDGNPRRQQMAAAIIDGEKEVLREAAEATAPTTSEGKKRRADTLEEEARQIRNPDKR